MYNQAFETFHNNNVEDFDIIQPFNKKVLKDGICPTLTTRPEGFKTAILVAINEDNQCRERKNRCMKNKKQEKESRKWELVNFCEFDKYAEKSYMAIHNVSKELNLGDINTVDETNMKPFNMICGGSPCQDFSISGKQKGSVWNCLDCRQEYNPLTVHWSKRDCCPNCNSKNIQKTRSSLLVEYLRIVRANKPNFGIYENVKNIVGKKFVDTFKLFTDELEEYGYNVYWKVLNAKDYGVPQNRERVYLIFIKKELDNGKFKFPESFELKTNLKDILEDKVDSRFYIDTPKTKELIGDLIAGGYNSQRNLGVDRVGYIEKGTGKHQSNMVYDANGIGRCLNACDYKSPMTVLEDNE